MRPSASTLKRKHVALIAAIAIPAAAAAGAFLYLDTTNTLDARISPIWFGNGADYVAVNGADFATLSLGTSNTSATLTVKGVPGAANVSLAKVLNVTNGDSAGKTYSIYLQRSAAPPGSVTNYVVRVVNATNEQQVVSWDVDSAATSSSFALAPGYVYYLSFEIVVADGTSAGNLGSLTISLVATPT